MSEHHGMSGFDQIAVASTQPGNNLGDTNFFGRLLPPGPTMKRDEVAGALAKLANSMDEGPNPNPSGDNPDLPLGFVFLGQFIDHDVTLDVTSSLKKASNVALIPNVRTPVLDLDSVYADGPEASSYLYRRGSLGPEFKDRFLIGNAQNPLDFPRTRDGIALIGDPRNDENGIISQLHLLFLRFHNAVLEAVENDDYDEVYDELVTGKDAAFEQTRRAVRRHYQWIVVNEFLPKIVDPGVIEQAKKDVIDSDAYKSDPIWGNAPSMPLEFAGAAYRFGHSMVRNTYTLNEQSQDLELFKNKGQTDKEALPSFNFVPRENVLDWRYFFEVDSSVAPQKVRQINTQMAHEFYNLPFVPAAGAAKGEASLAFRNLLRGAVTLSLPSGEAVAKAFGVTPIPLHEKVKAAGLTETPLWFYCLAEGEHFNSKLGPVGGRIVAMTLLRMLKKDPESYVCREGWKPFLGETPGQFTMADMVKFVEKHEAAHNVHAASVLNFDGTGDYVEVPNYPNPTDAMTISCWAKSNTPTWNNYGFLVSKRDAFVLHPNANAKSINFYIFSGGWRVTSVNPDIDITEWHHYAGTFDGSSIRLYIDGEEVARTNYSGKIDADNGSLCIAWDDGVAGRYFDGQMTEVRLWNIARREQDIKGDLNQRLVGNESGLVGYWPLNGDALDCTSPGKDGEINGATWTQENLPFIKPASGSATGTSHPATQPVVNFGEHFYLKSEDGKSIITSWQDPNDSSYHRIYPKFGTSGQIALFFKGGKGELTNNAAVQLISTESSIGSKNIMGAWRSKDACYYWTDHNSQMQWWTIAKVDGGDAKIRYGDKVYITNRQWNQPLAPYSNEYVSGKVSHPQYVWIIEKA